METRSLRLRRKPGRDRVAAGQAMQCACGHAPRLARGAIAARHLHRRQMAEPPELRALAQQELAAPIAAVAAPAETVEHQRQRSVPRGHAPP